MPRDMPATVRSERPKAVVHAEWALWTWTAWICLLGIYQTLASPSGADANLIAQVQATAGISLGDLRTVMIVGYVLTAISMALLIAQIGAGKRWVRASVLVSFILEVLWVIATSDSTADYLTALPDFGLLIYALYLLYTPPGRDWFATRPHQAT